MYNFGDDFIFGGATAAYQAEGGAKDDGRGPCIWDEYLNRPESKFNGDVASDFYHHYKEDLGLLKQIGFNSFRTSIQWSRLIKDLETGEPDTQGITFYKNVIAEAKKLGIELVMNLHHFDIPVTPASKIWRMGE